ncbi:MAG: LEVG family PEP-CTERM protein [Mastigocoleus sp.]
MANFKGFVKVLTVSTVGLTLLAGAESANAQSFLPQEEGEVELTNLICLTGDCIAPKGFTITSLDYSQDLPDDANYGVSRFFMDSKGTANDYGFGIKFKADDAGTNPHSSEIYWGRPVAFDKDGNAIENGELEVGRFLFTFDEKVSLDLSFLDVEESKGAFSSILKVNGNDFNQSLPAGADDNIQNVSLTNVKSFEVQLGNPGINSDITKFQKTGDGVNIQVAAKTPEPAATFSFAALAVAGMFGVAKRRKSTKHA